jgi:hypothetical protein
VLFRSVTTVVVAVLSLAFEMPVLAVLPVALLANSLLAVACALAVVELAHGLVLLPLRASWAHLKHFL